MKKFKGISRNFDVNKGYLKGNRCEIKDFTKKIIGDVSDIRPLTTQKRKEKKRK